MITIKIPTAFRPHVDGQRTVDVDVSNIGDLFSALTQQYPNLKSHLMDADGQLLSFVNVFVNDENIRDLAGNDTQLSDRDQVFLVPAMAGG